MGASELVSVAEVAALLAAVTLGRFAYAKTLGRGTPAPEADLQAIRAALGKDGGRIVRANRVRSGDLIAGNEYLDERKGGRLYHVTLQMGSVRIRRRVAVRDGAPALLLP
jgi:hypothetical protein